MAVGGCYSCMKYLLYFFNALLFLVGCAILVVGILVKVMQTELQAIIDQFDMDSFQGYDVTSMLDIAAYIFIGVGAFLIIIGIIGCCGACRETSWLLGVFFALLSLIFIVCVWAGVHLLVLTFQAKSISDQHLDDIVKKVDQKTAQRNEIEFLDTMQTSFECCGSYQGSSDFVDGNIPDSCKVENYNVPCAARFDRSFRTLTITGGSILGVAFFILIGMLLSLALCCAVRKVSGSNIA